MRLKLAISYAVFLMVAGALLLTVVWVFLLRYVPDDTIDSPGRFVPNRSDLVAAFLPNAVLALCGLLGFGLAGGWLLAGRMLAPLDRLTEGTRFAAAGDLSHRVQLQGRQDEFRELSDAFDSMLARIEAHVLEQQRFAANASHELRTPLAIMHAQLDVARKDPNHDPGELVERLHAVNTRAIDVTEALLLLSRADQPGVASEEVDVSLVADEVTETLLPLAERHGVSLEPSCDVASVLGSRALLLQMTTNLVHNAIVHNRPDGGTVWISTTLDGGSALVTIENTGDVLGAELVSTLTEPFQRGSERTRTDNDTGVGLGLAIVVRIVDAHDGAIALTPRPFGGLRIVIRLPAATAPAGR